MAKPDRVAEIARGIQHDAHRLLGPPPEGVIPSAQEVLPRSLFKHARSYIVRVVSQINGTYDNGWCDACAVMIRRLLETLIIEVFEHHSIGAKIKNANGDYFYLSDLIAKTLTEPSLTLTRNCKRALPGLKDVGDKSAHSRYFNATTIDIQQIRTDLRVAVEELLHHAGLK